MSLLKMMSSCSSVREVAEVRGEKVRERVAIDRKRVWQNLGKWDFWDFRRNFIWLV